MGCAKDSAKNMDWCTCDIGVAKALWAMSDWAEGTLSNFRRELEGELKPLDQPTNTGHLVEFRRLERDWWLGTSILKNTVCQNPLILKHFREFEALHEWVCNNSRSAWTKALDNQQFVPQLAKLVSDMLVKTAECKVNVRQTMAKMS